MQIQRKSNLILQRQYIIQGSCCYYCKKNVKFEHITKDHLLPVSQGHTLIGNKIFACLKCNMMKGNLSIEQFKLKILDRVKEISIRIINNDGKLSKSSLKKINNYTVIEKTLSEVINNGGLPKTIFT